MVVVHRGGVWVGMVVYRGWGSESWVERGERERGIVSRSGKEKILGSFFLFRGRVIV